MEHPFSSKENCCGCTACQNICPAKAITMKSDSEGFLYPSVNSEKCINCGKCVNVCDFKENPIDLEKNTPLVYAVKHKDENVRANSTSGGAFTAISDYILKKNGIVYGVAFDEKLNVVHQRATNKEERDRFRGSKYVQSNLENIFLKVKDDLKNNYKVLFTGTPCQVAGLKRYLGNDYTEQLILCDIVCLGVPSPLIWKEHINYYAKVKGNNIKDYRFRSKVNGWHSHTEEIILKNDKVDNYSLVSQQYKTLFHTNAALRPSCYNCPYTKIERISDFTIGDFWGIENCTQNFDDNRGVSLVLINNINGEKCFDKIKDDLILLESNINDCMQRQLKEPVKTSTDSKQFWQDYHQKGYEYILKKYADYSIKGKIKFIVKKYAGKIRVLEHLYKIKKGLE